MTSSKSFFPLIAAVIVVLAAIETTETYATVVVDGFGSEFPDRQEVYTKVEVDKIVSSIQASQEATAKQITETIANSLKASEEKTQKLYLSVKTDVETAIKGIPEKAFSQQEKAHMTAELTERITETMISEMNRMKADLKADIISGVRGQTP